MCCVIKYVEHCFLIQVLWLIRMCHYTSLSFCVVTVCSLLSCMCVFYLFISMHILLLIIIYTEQAPTSYTSTHVCQHHVHGLVFTDYIGNCCTLLLFLCWTGLSSAWNIRNQLKKKAACDPIVVQCAWKHTGWNNSRGSRAQCLPWCWCLSLPLLRNSTLYLDPSTPSKSCCCLTISSSIRELFFRKIPERREQWGGQARHTTFFLSEMHSDDRGDSSMVTDLTGEYLLSFKM